MVTEIRYVMTNVPPQFINMDRGVLLAKLGIKQAYKMILVHPQEKLLLGINGRSMFT